MLIDQKETTKVLRQIVSRLAPDRALHEDLTQEAFIHLWLREVQCPGQTKSWYFQSCRFFLQNQLRAGRSVDSIRRQQVRTESVGVTDRPDPLSAESLASDAVLALVSARDALGLLEQWLTKPEREILGLLMEGYGVREIAGKVGTSHSSVIRHRRKIAALAHRLQIGS